MFREIKPISMINRPIQNEKEDAFHLDIQAQELDRAVANGANFIGIISDYGGGKSSTVQAFAKHGKYQLCNICLWSYVDDLVNNKRDVMAIINQSFLYQLSKIVKRSEFSRHVNRMMSTNYKTISWSSDVSRKKFAITIVIFFVYLAILLTGTLYKINIKIPEMLTKIANLAGSLQTLTPYFVLAILFLFYNNCVSFSWHKDNIKRSFSEADEFEIFDLIIKNGRKKKEKYIISIEDLDRISEEKYIYDFLKMLYKYNNLLTEEDKKEFIFCVSISEKIYAEISCRSDEIIHYKIFDYILFLRPISKKKRKDIFMKVIQEQYPDLKANLKINKLGEREIDWIIKGENIGIREIKFRLNRAMGIWEELNRSSNAPEFLKCAIVAYFENTYAKDMYNLILHREQLQENDRKINAGESEKKEPDAQDSLVTEIRKILSKMRKKEKNFENEFLKLFGEGIMTGEDFETYFYRNPRE